MRNAFRIAVVALTLTSAFAGPLLARQMVEPSGTKLSGSAPAPRRGFNVVLLVGDMMGPGYPKVIPEAALRALSDMRDFLPYKGYNLLDTQWIIGNSTPGMPAITRLRGLDDQDYELELRASPNVNGMSVRFMLRESADGAADSTRSPFPAKDSSKNEVTALEISREIFQLERERDDLQPQLTKKRKDVEVGMASIEDVKRMDIQLTAVNRRIADLKQTAAATSSTKVTGRAVIDTSFQMTDGETVVVGTSKVKGGGKALIALLTATTDRKGSTK